ncbi:MULTISPECIES: DMT family transporter [unclassified Modestobacter]|uniref:DMT family transporter n=1 Tax=unclassified Modestobacter TaxID=2643866 RepID=UPI0022AB3802|nr:MULTISPECIES: DMT family transporter [unclassified Modestobacter]MCZ2826345.1 DMT family transporter [Modestobacter sp. VKM Ac-2981]MCZ2852590.1 DMT family transporter [Modestobacter sp. VKM Ac-2982]
MTVYLLALGAALLFGIGSVVQQRVAFTAPPGKTLRLSLLWWLVRQPPWLIGVGTAVVGNLFSGAALGMGSVALVQPLLVARLLFALPISAVWARQRLTRRDWLGMLATAGGLAGFLVIARPEEGADVEPPLWQWLVVLAVIGSLVGGLVATARKLAPAREAPMLGAGAGMLFALQSAFTHVAVSAFLDDGIGGLLSSWTTYAVAVTAVAGTLLAQSAYEMAPLAASYPALAATEPLAAIGISVVVLGTALAVGVLPLAGFLVALAVMTVGIYLLATSPLVTGQSEVIARKAAEEEVAEREREVEGLLHDLAGTVSWLEECRTRTRRPGQAAVDRRLQRLDELVPRLDAALERLADAGGQAAVESAEQAAEQAGTPLPEQPAGDGVRSGSATPARRQVREELAATLARYEEEARARDRRLAAEAAELRTRAETQRRSVAAERRGG